MKTAFKKSFIIVLITLILITNGITSVRAAATLTITNTNNIGPGSLPDTLASAGAGDTIIFDPSLSGGVIHLAFPLDITKAITIDGSALAVRITISGDTDSDGTGNVRVLRVNNGVTATLNSLVITKGVRRSSAQYDYGAGIYNDGGKLTINNSIISGNYAVEGGGIYNDGGLLTINNSTISGNTGSYQGGGIYNDGGLTINNSILSNNSAIQDGGGGIYNLGTLTITNSTFSGNSASYAGGGLYNYGGTVTMTNDTLSSNSSGDGGGIFNDGMLTISNSTFSGNGNSSSFGGGIANDNTLTITNSTLSGNLGSNGGGLYNSSQLFYTNTIIANSPSGSDCLNSGGQIQTNINNLVENGGCSASLSGDPNLGPLANNGGATLTFALLAGSIAIDAGNNAACTTTPVNNLDQRGFTRPSGTQCDIGSYEYNSIAATPTTIPPTPTITATPTMGATLTVTNINDNGFGSLRDTLASAGNGDTIIFDTGLSGATIHLASTITVTQNVSIDGSALATPISISGDSDGNGTGDVGVLWINSSVTATLNSLIITKGMANNGGGIYNQGMLTLTNSTIIGNSTSLNNGGGIYNTGTLTITNSIISGNSAHNNGGGIYNYSSLTISNSTISGNSTFYAGGGIYSYNSNVTVTNSTLFSNSSDWGGGGIYSERDALTVTNSTLAANSAASFGGGIYSDSDLILRNSTISDNSASNQGGGGIYNYSQQLHYTNTIIANSPSGQDCINDFGTIVTNMNNLVEDGSCSPTLSGDPNLGPLADNGGSTLTFALLSGSSAIDAGNDTACSAWPINNMDQRGVARPDGTHCDIGSYEYAPSIIFPTKTATVTPIASLTPVITSTKTTTPTITATPTETATQTETVTSTTTATKTPTITPTATNTPAICNAQTQIPPAECNALVTLYNSTHGSSWLDHTSWLSSTTPCDTWDGVVCTDGHVTELFLTGNRLTGTIPAQLSDLTQLDELDLNQNALTGSIPTEFGNLTSLSSLDLSQNQLTGSIPPQLGSLTNLVSLNLQKNQLTGSIPPELGNATGLYYLNLQNNLLTGSIPPTIGHMTNLGILSLSANKISGNIPAELGNLSNLQSLYLDTTQMAGEIPASFAKLKSLFNLKLNCGLTSSSTTVAQFINKLIPGWLTKVCLPTLTFKSSGAQDGWVIETAENSNVGGALNSTATTFKLGDHIRKMQYRSILSFNTQALPDNATIIKVTLKVKKSSITGVGDPLSIFQGFMVDIKTGYFGVPALEAADFQAPASGTYGPITPPLVSNVYSLNLTGGAANINALATNGGLTQIRLRFKLDDNNNAVANTLSLFSGNATNAADRPQLVVTYYAP